MPDLCPTSCYSQDPRPFLNVISTAFNSDFPDAKVRRLSSDAPLLDIVAAFAVARRDQSAVAFASTLAGSGTSETDLYILFNGTPPPTIQSHLRSLFTLLRTTPRPDLEQDKTIASISSLVYLYSWERWTFYLRKIMDSLQVIEEKAEELGLQDVFDINRPPFPEIRALGVILTMNRKEAIPFAVSTIAQLSSTWRKKRIIDTRLSRADRELVGLLPYTEGWIRETLGLSIPLCLWITRVLSVHETSAALVRLASLQSFGIIRGPVNIVVLPPSSPVLSSPHTIVDGDVIKAAVLHVRLTSESYTTYELYHWNDQIYDEAVQEFIEWATNKIRDRDSRQPEHPHCEVDALSYIHRHGLQVYPYIASSDLTCETCKVIIEAYFSAQGSIASPISSSGRMEDTCPIPKFDGPFGETFRMNLHRRLEMKVALTVIRWIDHLPVSFYYREERKRRFRPRLPPRHLHPPHYPQNPHRGSCLL
ncbi:hypothetical protein PM082_013608 [Marasmius tenuissimus]|nr:hypothetical protein PM082_013608 [Marasmius tenuissimus]